MTKTFIVIYDKDTEVMLSKQCISPILISDLYDCMEIGRTPEGHYIFIENIDV